MNMHESSLSQKHPIDSLLAFNGLIKMFLDDARTRLDSDKPEKKMFGSPADYMRRSNIASYTAARPILQKFQSVDAKDIAMCHAYILNEPGMTPDQRKKEIRTYLRNVMIPVLEQCQNEAAAIDPNLWTMP